MGDGLLSICLLIAVICNRGFQLSLITAYLGSLLPDIIDNSPLWSKVLHKKYP